MSVHDGVTDLAASTLYQGWTNIKILRYQPSSNIISFINF